MHLCVFPQYKLVVNGTALNVLLLHKSNTIFVCVVMSKSYYPESGISTRHTCLNKSFHTLPYVKFVMRISSPGCRVFTTDWMTELVPVVAFWTNTISLLSQSRQKGELRRTKLDRSFLGIN